MELLKNFWTWLIDSLIKVFGWSRDFTIAAVMAVATFLGLYLLFTKALPSVWLLACLGISSAVFNFTWNYNRRDND